MSVQMIRCTFITFLALAMTAPAIADPAPQLAQSVSMRLERVGVDVDPARLTTAQASALHLLLVTERRQLTVRRRAEAILRNPDFRD